MIKLVDLLKESVSSNIYKVTFQNNNFQIEETNLNEISKISNLIYDMGGGESVYDPSPNIVTIDYISVDDYSKWTLAEWGNNLSTKYYILQDLNIPFSLPKADKIILSKVVIYIKNIESLAESVNNSLKSNGQIEFFAEHGRNTLSKRDTDFLQILNEKYSFQFPNNQTVGQLKKDPTQSIILQKGSSFIAPPKIMKYEIKNTETGEIGFVQYEGTKNKPLETVSDNFKDDFYKEGKPIVWSGFPWEDKGPFIYNNSYYPKREKYKLIKRIK
jgi:hypothetical protein